MHFYILYANWSNLTCTFTLLWNNNNVAVLHSCFQGQMHCWSFIPDKPALLPSSSSKNNTFVEKKPTFDPDGLCGGDHFFIKTWFSWAKQSDYGTVWLYHSAKWFTQEGGFEYDHVSQHGGCAGHNLSIRAFQSCWVVYLVSFKQGRPALFLPPTISKQQAPMIQGNVAPHITMGILAIGKFVMMNVWGGEKKAWQCRRFHHYLILSLKS